MENKNSLSYKLGQALATIIVACVVSLIILLTLVCAKHLGVILFS